MCLHRFLLFVCVPTRNSRDSPRPNSRLVVHTRIASKKKWGMGEGVCACVSVCVLSHSSSSLSVFRSSNDIEQRLGAKWLLPQ